MIQSTNLQCKAPKKEGRRVTAPERGGWNFNRTTDLDNRCS